MGDRKPSKPADKKPAAPPKPRNPGVDHTGMPPVEEKKDKKD